MTSLRISPVNARKQRCVTYLGGQCVQCGYARCTKALTFHHRDSGDKEFAVSQILDRQWGVIRKELDKCDLLCFNCHMEKHCELDVVTRHELGEPISESHSH